jgi:hypothetical protein
MGRGERLAARCGCEQGRGKGSAGGGGDPDSWAPPVSGRAKKRREERLLGCGGPQAGAGPKARKRREREKGGLLGCGLRRDRWAGGLKREREVWEGVFFLFIFQTPFSKFQKF